MEDSAAFWITLQFDTINNTKAGREGPAERCSPQGITDD